jgi:Protein of unknown function (DUF998)
VQATVRAGALAGALAPFLFLLGTAGVSRLDEDHMNELGWEVWPSGLALGPHGWLQILNFIVLGLLLIAFAVAVHAVPARNRWVKAAPVLLALAGVGALVLAFNTDPPDRDATWHGILHGVGYVIWLVSLVLAYPFTWWRLRGSTLWRGTARYGVAAVLVFLPKYLLPDEEAHGNYVFFAVVFLPLAAMAIPAAVGAFRQAAESDASDEPRQPVIA